MYHLRDNPDDKTIPIDKIIDRKTHISVNVSNTPSSEFSRVLEDLFGGSFLNSIKGMAMVALNSLLGSGSAGSTEVKNMKVVYLYGAVVRIDYMMYSYTVRTENIHSKVKNGVCFYGTIATVKLATVPEEVIAYVLGQSADQAARFLSDRSAWIFKQKTLVQDIENGRTGDSGVKELAQQILHAYGLSLSRVHEEKLSKTPLDKSDVVAIGKVLLDQENGTLQPTREAIQKEQMSALLHITEFYQKIREMRTSLRIADISKPDGN